MAKVVDYYFSPMSPWTYLGHARFTDALARYGTALLPLDYASQSHTTPVFCYPYARSREALDALRSGPSSAAW